MLDVTRMTKLLYLDDHYLKEFEAVVFEILDPKSVILDRTALYPKGGGQPSDHGRIVFNDGTTCEVIESVKSENGVVHLLSNDIQPARKGEEVRCTVDWPLRYLHMRYHTALHILSGVAFLSYGARITGGQIYSDRARLDFALEDLSKERVASIESQINRIVTEDREVKTYWLSAEEALKRKDMYRLSADLLPKGLDKLRIVDILGFDAQFDGGTHVRRTSEVGEIRITKTQNKGRDNKRIEIVLSPSTS